MTQPNLLFDIKEKENTVINYCKQYEDLLNSIPFAIYIYDKHGTIIEVNVHGKKLLELNTDKKNIKQYIENSSLDIFSSHCQHVLSSCSSQLCFIKMKKNNDTKLNIKMISIQHQNDLDKKFFIISCLSETKQSMSPGQPSYVLDSLMLNNINQKLAIISNYLYGSINYLKNQTNNIKILNSLKFCSAIK